jgi:hypothetical protein
MRLEVLSHDGRLGILTTFTGGPMLRDDRLVLIACCRG